MELWLRVAGATGDVETLAVALDPADTLDDLRRALGPASLGTMTVARSGLVLRGDALVSTSDIRRGDLLVLGRSAPAPSAPSGFTVVVAGGADVGAAHPLDDGRPIVVGRSSRADLTVADATLSGRHAELVLTGEEVRVQDLGSSNGSYLNGTLVTEATAVLPGDVLELGDVALRLVRVETAAPPRTVDGYVQFTRRPRLAHPRGAEGHELMPPPDALQKRRLALSSALLPLALAPVMAVTTHQPSYLAMAALSPLMALASLAEDRRHGRKDHAGRVDAFRRAVREADESLATRLRSETSERWLRSPDPAEVLRRARGPQPSLWERRMTDPDALELRVGWGDLPSSARWSMREGGDPALRTEAAELLERHGVVRSAPVTIGLQNMPVLGLVGPAPDVHETGAWLTVQAAAMHSPRDLRIVGAVSEPNASRWDWLPWLPHTQPETSTGPPLGVGLAVGPEQARQLVADLTSLVTDRQQRAASRDSSASRGPTLLVVLDEDLRLPRTAVADLLEVGPYHDVRVLWLGTHVDTLPGETTAIAELRGGTVDLTLVNAGVVAHEALRDRCPERLVHEVAWALAGVRDASARSGAGDLPTLVTLAELLDGDLTAAACVRRWQEVHPGLGAPIGRGAGGVVALDLRRDGPHGLLGGTTGAGKSEMLQTLVASLAAHHPPDRLTFLLVDYKGGAAFKDCVELPHVVGFVTDLSGHLVHRALVSLAAELHRRERLLSSVGAKDLLEMQLVAPDRAPASLLLVVDEFATLAKELPDFVDGVVNVAQRGRSLGIHLLLATQRPAGAINDNIRANTNLRMALRMNDAMDSQDVIGVSAAALLPRHLPGRAFVRAGAGDLTEVQVAYSGSQAPARREAVVRRVVRGRVQAVESPAPAVERTSPTDLQRTVRAAVEAARTLGLPPQPTPWLPALPDVVLLSSLDPPPAEGIAQLGLLDLPAEQRQPLATIDLAREGSLLVLGTSGAGKTSLLRTLAVSLAEHSPPAELTLYVLDFASRGLGSLGSLPHCGGVVLGDDLERVERLFGMLERWTTERRRRFADAGVSSLSEHRGKGSPGGVLPRVVVLLDSYDGFAATFEKIDYGARVEALPRLVSEGQALGMHFVITGSRRHALPTALSSALARTLVLRLADPDDYLAAGLDARAVKGVELSPGRGFDNLTREVQCAVVSSDPSGAAQQEEVTRRGAELARRWPGSRAGAVETLPQDVPANAVRGLSRPLRPVVGLGERELAPVVADLTESHLLVAGPLRSGKSTTLLTIAAGLREADPELELVLLAPRRSPLTSQSLWSASAGKESEIQEHCAGLAQRLDARDESSQPVVIVVDDAHELLDHPASYDLEVLVRKGRDRAVRVVAASDAQAAIRAYGGWLTELRKDRHAVLLQPDPDTDGDLAGVRLPRRSVPVPGRGYLVSRIGAEGLQVAVR